MSENEHQSYFCYLIGQKIYLPLFFFVSSYQTWGYLVDWKEKGKKLIKEENIQLKSHGWLTDCAVTIIRKSKPGQVSQTADSYVDELFFFRSNCVKALIWFILKIIKAHTYIPNTSSYRLKHSTVKHSNPSLHNIDLKHLRIMFKSEDCIYYYFFFPSFECWTDRVSLVYKTDQFSFHSFLNTYNTTKLKTSFTSKFSKRTINN